MARPLIAAAVVLLLLGSTALAQLRPMTEPIPRLPPSAIPPGAYPPHIPPTGPSAGGLGGGSGGGNGGGGGGGACPPACHPVFYVPPVPVYEDDERRKALAGLARTLKAARDNQSRGADLDAAINIIGSRWAITSEVINDEFNRAIILQRTRSAMREIMTQLVDASIEQMLVDVNRLKPYWWDTSATAAEKRAVIRTTEQELHSLETPAAVELYDFSRFSDQDRAGKYYRDQQGRAVLQYEPGAAHKQLQSIHENKCWEKHCSGK
jgi:hypothetical protein